MMEQSQQTNGGFHPRKWTPDTPLSEGAWIGVPSPVYHAFEAVSRSMCVDVADHTPAYALARATHEQEPTPDMVFGLAVESYVMDSEAEFSRKIKVQAGRGNSNAYKEQKEQHPDAHLMTQERMDRVVGAGKALLNHAFVGRLIEGATHKHLVCVWRDDRGLLCKCQVDFLCLGFGLVWDLKTTGPVTDHAIETMFSANRLLFQPPFYLAGLRAVGLDFDNFGFVVVSRDPDPDGTHPIRLKMYDDEALALGMRELGYIDGVHGVLDVIADCISRNRWPGYEDEFTYVDLKRWKKNQLEGVEDNEH